jgi:hypothetical protein
MSQCNPSITIIKKIFKNLKNIYTPHICAPKFITQTLMTIKGQIGPDMIVGDDLKTPLS